MPHRLSLFSQRLERVAYVAYFLGAIIPLGALALVVASSNDNAGPTLGPELVGFVVAASVLSFACFLLLRHITRRALERMDGDARRLATLLNASTALASAQDALEASRVAATYAARLTGSRAAYVVAKDPAGNVEWRASAGVVADEIRAARGTTLQGLATAVVDDGRPAMRTRIAGDAGADAWLAPTTVAVPFVTDAGLTVAALMVVHGADDGRFEPQHLDALLTLAGFASVALANAELRKALASERRPAASPGTIPLPAGPA